MGRSHGLRIGEPEQRSIMRSQAVADLVVMTVQTRDVRGGKGERDLFRSLLVCLHSRLPRTAEALLATITTQSYGSLKDIVQLVEEVDDQTATCQVHDGCRTCPRLHELRKAAVAVLIDALRKDKATLEAQPREKAERTSVCPGRERKLSLVGKWAPREGRRHSKLARELAGALFPEAPTDARKLYRRLVAGLNRRLGTVELAMCDGTWDIDPGTVPARCLKIHKAAFMNIPRAKDVEKGRDERSADKARIECARRFKEHVAAAVNDPTSRKRVHGAALQPHELVHECLAAFRNHCVGCKRPADDADPINEAQWVDLRDTLRSTLPDGGLGYMVPLVDVSGSMYGQPLEVAVALGLLVAEFTGHPVFRDRMLTFETNPQWHNLPPAASSTLYERVRSAVSAPFGGSTNFAAAMGRLLEVCIQAELKADEVAKLKLVVFSDMQFDDANGDTSSAAYGYYTSPNPPSYSCQDHQAEPASWQTHYERLCDRFQDAGFHTVPTVVFWNLRGGTGNYPADAHTPGVIMLSGFSPSLLKLFCEGDTEALLQAAEDAEGPPQLRSNAYQELRKVLDDERYQAVRELCAKVGEGELAGYVAPPVLDWTLVNEADVEAEAQAEAGKA
eukprot:jgi/Tetstr1/443623/TSEL_031622.t1